MIYLDNAATSLKKTNEVLEAVEEAMVKYTANAGRGAYKVAQDISIKMMETRENINNFFV